jgi:GntR family transcriptional regulator
MLDKTSPIPLYYQLYSLLLEAIHSGEYKPGEMLPPEVMLMQQYGVSRGTVRQAILDLVKNGYIYREKSKGSFIKERHNIVGHSEKIKGFTALSSRGGKIPLRSVALKQEVIEPPKNISKNLQLHKGEKVFYLKRVRYIENEVNTFVEDYLPYRICPGIEKHNFSKFSLYDVLERYYNVIPHHAQRTFESTKATTEEELEQLEISVDMGILRCESFVYNINDEPIEYYVALIKGTYTVYI